MKFLVTGGAGFIGSNIVAHLVARGEAVRVLDNFSTGRRVNLEPFGGAIELVEGDLRDPGVVKKALGGVTYVLHQAALPSVPRSLENPVASHEANITGTLNLLLAARDAGVKRVVMASSSSVYGDSEVLPVKESFLPAPLSPYAVTKLAGEMYARAFYHSFGLETVTLRYFNVFGPRQDPASQYAAVVPRFIKILLNGGRPTIYGDGLQSRDFTYVDNVAQANLAALAAPGVGGQVFNVACGGSHSVLKLWETLSAIAGKKIEPQFEPPRRGEIRNSWADISKAGAAFDYRVQIDFAEGLERTYRWFAGSSEK